MEAWAGLQLLNRMAHLRENFGVGTGYNSNGITGRKSVFNWDEKIYACHVWDDVNKNDTFGIAWERQEGTTWKRYVDHSWTNSAGYSNIYHWSSIRYYQPGKWRVWFLYQGGKVVSVNFTINPKPAPPPPPTPQPGYLMGTVTDKNTGKGLINVKVEFMSYSTKTDLVGKYVLEIPQGFSGLVKFSLLGYKNYEVIKTLGPGISETEYVKLEPIAPPPPPVVIPEETKEFWMEIGYTSEDAQKIADWVKANKITPTLATIENIILGEYAIGTAYRIAWEKVIEKAKAGDILGMSLALIELGNVKIAPDIQADVVYIGPASVPALLLRGGSIAKIGIFILKNYKLFFTVIASAYGISFATSWFGKEGLIEQVSIPLSDIIKDLKYEVTQEKLDIAESYYAKYTENIETAAEMISVISWLWLPTRSEWLAYIETARLDLALKRKLLDGFKIEVEIPKLPEIVRTQVRDIIDGDTIDVKPDIEGSLQKLPEYGTTTHARIRILGINAPEKSPKGEIVCTGIEIYKVEATYTDQSRNVLLPLNEKIVTLYIDPAHTLDSYGRILAKVVYAGSDIALEQIKRGLACYYHVEDNKYENKALYEAETLKAKSAGVGMWKEVIEVEKGEILFSIDSTPTNATVSIDGIATHHNTPTDEIEQKDVIALWTDGAHTLKLEKSGMMKEVSINLERNKRLELVVDLTTMPVPEIPEIPEVPEVPEVPEISMEKDKLIIELRATIENLNVTIEILNAKIAELTGAPTPIPEVPAPPPTPPKLPATYTAEQEWALKKAFDTIWELTKGAAQMSEQEYTDFVASFNMYSAGQKEVLNILFAELYPYIKGAAQLSGDEFIFLKERFRIGWS